jgi:hypothetical protein
MAEVETKQQLDTKPEKEKADIVDVRPFRYEKKKTRLDEAAGDSDEPLVVKGILQRANAQNQNGRIYPKKVLKREVEDYKKLINERRALGELDHPDSSVVNLKNVSHMVTDVWWKGNDLMGEVKVLDTPNGRILKSLLNDNVNIGISSRGMGSVKEQTDGTLRVGNDFDLIAWDFVSNPSTHGAFMDEVNEGVVQEGLITESREAKKEMDRWKDVNSFASELIEEMSEEYEIE